MTNSGSNQDDQNSADPQRAPNADRHRWVNNPETVHSMADVEDGAASQNAQGNAFILTEGESVVASKSTARAEAAAREQAWDEAVGGAHKPTAVAAAPDVSTDDLLSQWSGQKQARKAKNPGLQEDLLQRIRSEIDQELEQIRQERHPIGSTLILMARAFGKDPKQWLPDDKVSNLLIEAVLYSTGMELPWGFDSIPDYAELKYIFGQDKRFSRVFRYDKYRPNESAADFVVSPVEDGDIAIWINQESKLSGLIEKAEGGRHNVISAGCPDTANGFIYTTLEFFVQTYAPANPTPDVVYRLVRLGRA